MLKKLIIILSLIFFNQLVYNPVFAEDNNLEIFHTNDVHGRLLPLNIGVPADKELGGIARRYTLLNQLKDKNAPNNFLLLDAGDIAQGTPLFSIFKGLVDVEFMNKLGYNAAVTGNHEYDKGYEILAGMANEAHFPVLAANINFPKYSILYNKVKPYTILPFKGYKVGIIGLVTDEVRLVTNIDKETKVLDPIKTAKKYIKQIDPETDVIILLTHIGYKKDYLLASKIKNADIIVGGHSHTTLKEPVVVKDTEGKPVIIVQAGHFGKTLGDLIVKIKDDQVSLVSYKLHVIDSSIKPDEKIQNELKQYENTLKNYANHVVGETKNSINLLSADVRKKETNGGDFVADAIKNTFKDQKVEIVFHNGGAIRSDKILPPGNITKLDIIELDPFEDNIILYDLKGKDIKSTLERSVSNSPGGSGGFLQVSGITFEVDLSKKPQTLTKDYMKIKEEGERVFNILVNGKPLNEKETYRVASNLFLYNGGNGFWAIRDQSKNMINSKKTVDQAIEDYIIKYSPITPILGERIKFVNLPAKKDEKH